MKERKNTNIKRRWKIRNLIEIGGKFIDYKIGILGAFFMGGVVFYINYSTTEILGQSLVASLKQGVYTFFFGGSIMKGCEYLATNIRNKAVALLAAILIPSAITLTLTFGVHKLKGTPMPVESTYPTLLIIPATAVWGYKKRKEKL